jgi:hypothetical protein
MAAGTASFPAQRRVFHETWLSETLPEMLQDEQWKCEQNLLDGLHIILVWRIHIAVGTAEMWMGGTGRQTGTDRYQDIWAWMCFKYAPAVMKYGYSTTGIVYFFKQYLIEYVDYIILNGRMTDWGTGAGMHWTSHGQSQQLPEGTE